MSEVGFTQAGRANRGMAKLTFVPVWPVLLDHWEERGSEWR